MVILVPVLASLTWRSTPIPLGGCREKMSRGGKTEEARDVILRSSLRCVPEKGTCRLEMVYSGLSSSCRNILWKE